MKPIIAVPAIAALVYRAWSHKSLTPAGIVVAALTAVAHAVHPWNMPFVLLVVFFLAGTRVTKIKQSEKEKLTLGSKGSPGGEGPRTHIQVLANSLVASILILLHAWQLHHQVPSSGSAKCYPYRGSILPIGIIAHYAAVCADTFSSELGILSRSPPRLITSLTLRKVPPGTNGGVTAWGLAAGLLGALVVVSAAMLSLPLCKSDPSTPPPATPEELDASPYWTVTRGGIFVWSLALCGLAGSLLDSILGGLFQRTVRDVQTGKIVEGEGGARVLVTDERRDARVRASLNAALLRGAEGTSAVEEMDVVGKNQVRLTRSGKMAAEEMEEKRKTSLGAGPSRVVESGINLLDNNQVNILMAALVSLGAMAAASVYWGVPLSSAFTLS